MIFLLFFPYLLWHLSAIGSHGTLDFITDEQSLVHTWANARNAGMKDFLLSQERMQIIGDD